MIYAPPVPVDTSMVEREEFASTIVFVVRLRSRPALEMNQEWF